MALDTFYEEVHIDYLVRRACAIDCKYEETVFKTSFEKLKHSSLVWFVLLIESFQETVYVITIH